MPASERYLEAITRWSVAKRAVDAESQRTDPGAQRRWEKAYLAQKDAELTLHRMARPDLFPSEPE